MGECAVIVPTYNERENIEALIARVMALPDTFHLLVVDDSSPDGTAELVRNHIAAYPERLHLEVRSGKLGLGTAYVHGFRWALDRGYQYIFEMDADFSHNPDDLLRLWEPCHNEGYDLAIGSRYIKGVNVVNWPMDRVLMSYYASVYVRMITGMKIRDTTAGFKCFRREALAKVLSEPIRFVGYAFQIEMKFKTWLYGFRIIEVPIIFTDRAAGDSKMSQGIVREAIWGVISMKLMSIFRRSHYRIRPS
jgi:dolichol-phosphate mannosyltransferase